MSVTPPGFDEAKFVLGSLCKRGHDWEGTGKSLRRIGTSGEKLGKARDCMQCHLASTAAYGAANAKKVNANQAAWRAANKEKIRDYLASYRAANAEKIRAYLAANYSANTDRHRARNAAWRTANAERVRACSAAYRNANGEKIRADIRRRRDRKAAALALQHITPAQSRQRLKDFGGSCAFCGATGALHIDHFLPLSAGNALTLGNAVPACQRCNCSKNAADPWHWYNRQHFFDQKRWDRILKVLGKENIHHGQMVLI